MTHPPQTDAQFVAEMAQRKASFGQTLRGQVIAHVLLDVAERDRLVLLAAQPTCGTCSNWNRATTEMDDSDDPTMSGWHRCDSAEFPSGGTYTPPTFGCTLHAPAPPEARP